MVQFRRLQILALFSVLAFFSFGKLPVTTDSFDSIPFEIGDNGKIYVNACVNTDTTPLRFLLDTGSVDNILNINSGRALTTIDPRYLNESLCNTTTSQISVAVTPYEHSIIIGETEFQGVRFVIAPCAEEIDGIIGWNTLTGVDFLIDYDRQIIEFFENGEGLVEDGSKWIPIAFIDGLPSINIDLVFEGRVYQINVWLDSASDRCLDLSTHFVLENDLEGKQSPWGFSEIIGMEGVGATIEEVTGEKLQIGDYSLYQVPIGLNLSNSGTAANKDFGGVIGNNLLQRFNQIWSFYSRRLYLEPNRRMYSTTYKPLNELLKNRYTLQ